MLTLKGKGSQQMIEAKKVDETEIFISLIKDGDQSIWDENFDNYGHKST